MAHAEEFITNFHNLKGSTVGDRRKNLFLLLRRFKSADSRTVEKIVYSLIPKTHLETLFRVELLLFFKRSTELFDVLKGGNEQLASKIFKNPWFFQHPFDELSADGIVNNLLPSLSFVSRNRVLRCLAKHNKDEVKLDSVFDALLERYGIQAATLLLPGCSTDKMKIVFTSLDVALSLEGLKLLFNKDVHVFQIYVEKCSHSHDDYSKIAKDVILKEPEMYLNMKQLHEQLGKKSTRRLLIYDKNRIVANPIMFQGAHFKTIYKFLCRKDAVLFFKKLFPSDLRNLWCETVFRFLKYFPKSEQFPLYAETFESTYGKSLSDKTAYVKDYMLESIQNASEREKQIQNIFKGSKLDDYVQYYNTDKAIGLMKEKILSCNNSGIQFDMAKKMIITCRINNDLTNLMYVLEFLRKHTRFEVDWFKEDILSLLNSSFNLVELKDEYWSVIISFCKSFKIERHYKNTDKQIFFKYIEYLWKSNQHVDDKFIEFLKYDDVSINDCKVINKPEELDKYLLNLVIQVLSDIFKEEDQPFSSVQCILWIYALNSRHTRSKVSVYNYPLLVTLSIKYIEEVIDKNEHNYSLKDLFTALICEHSLSELKKTVIEIYLKRGCEKYSSDYIALWLLKYQPDALLAYSDDFIKYWCRYISDRVIWDYVKKISHYNYCEKALDYCVNNYASNSVASYTVPSLLTVMAYLMRPEDFVNTVSKHIPDMERIDIEDEDSKASYSINSCVAKVCKYTKSVVTLPTLVKFCKGDYLRDALESLYYLFYHSPENQLNSLLEELSTRAVSVRKHVFFLTSQVGSVNGMLSLTKFASEHEKNVSIKKHILNTVMKYFRRNPFDATFELLKLWIPTLNFDDTETFESLRKIRDIPVIYRGKYFVFLLKYLISKADESAEVRTSISSCLKEVDGGLMKELPADFCESLIEKYFLANTNTCFSQNDIDQFVVNYWVRPDSNYQRKTELILSKLLKYKNMQQGTFKATIIAPKRIAEFIDSFIYSCDKQDKSLISIVHDTWLKLFTVKQFFSIYITLKMMLLKAESKDISTYSKNICSFAEELNSSYGPYFLNELATSVKSCLSWEEKYGDTAYLICYTLLQSSQSVINCVLILYLLPSKQPKKQELCSQYFSLCNALEEHPDTTVKILFNKYVKSMEHT